MSPFAGD